VATAAPKKTAARKPTDRPRKRTSVKDIPMPEIEVLELNSEDMEEDEPDLVEIFRLDGKPYYVDRNRGAGVAMRMLKTFRVEGEEAAIADMLLELLGEQAFDDLSNYPRIRPRHLAQVLLSCQKAILGDDSLGPKA
jgi:hypothetical protein